MKEHFLLTEAPKLSSGTAVDINFPRDLIKEDMNREIYIYGTFVVEDKPSLMVTSTHCDTNTDFVTD